MRQYIGARYVPRFSDVNNGIWSNVYSYEPLTIVKNGNDYYTSKQSVPVGVAITNTDYWVLTGNYNGAISHLQDEIDDINSTISVLSDINDIISVLPELYSDSKTYSTNDLVIYEGSEYIAIASTTGHVPTNTTYWLELGSISEQMDNLKASLLQKADLALFDVVNVPITVNASLASKADITFNVKQSGKTVFVYITITTTGGKTGLDSGDRLNDTPIPHGLTTNLGFGADIVGGTNSGSCTRMVMNVNGQISMIGTVPQGSVVETSIILPAAGYI